jgi:hypothetical protein
MSHHEKGKAGGDMKTGMGKDTKAPAKGGAGKGGTKKK